MNKIKWISIIRISALLLILIYHFFNDILPGGFIGVDVFFTLSGYLVTLSIIDEYQKYGKYSFFHFVKRRFTRLYPPLLLAILFTLPFTLMLSPDFIAGIGRQISAALGFITNYYEIFSGGSYEEKLLPHLFVHTWFLSVQVHLYLLWGLVCVVTTLWVTWRINRRNKIHSDKGVYCLRRKLFILSIAGAIFSYLRMQALYNNILSDPSVAYFDTFARAFPFLMGAATGALFTYTPNKQENISTTHTNAKRIILICVLAAQITVLFKLAGYLQFSSEETYRFGIVITAILTCLIIILVRILHCLIYKIKEPTFITILDKLSYNIYLFHWPLYIVFFYFITNNLVSVGLSLAITIILSVLVYYVFEQYFSKQHRSVFVNSPALRRLNSIVIILFVLPVVLINSFILINAPKTSLLEEQIRTGNLYQDIDRIKSVNNMINAINSRPLILSKQMMALGTSTRGLDVLTNPISNQSMPVEYYELLPLNEYGILFGATVIGDSISLSARRKLIEAIPNCFVDLEISREIWQGYEVMMNLHKNNSLREYVVISLGTNAHKNSIEYIDKIIRDIPPGHRLIFVTPYLGTWNETRINYKTMKYEQELPKQHQFVTIADWAAIAESNPHILDSDKIHIGKMEGINMFVNCVIDAIDRAGKKPAKQSKG